MTTNSVRFSKLARLFISSIVLSMFVCSFSGCNSQENEAKPFYVYFNSNGGSLVSGKTSQYVKNANEIEPPVFELKGYTFDGWDIPLETVTETTNVGALWKACTYTITYNLNGGTNNALNPTHFNVKSEKIVLKDAYKPGYFFEYWSTWDGTRITTINPSEARNYVVYANYRTLNYTISYELNGGSFDSAEPTTYSIERQTSIPNAHKSGYTFVGWSYSQDGSYAVKDLVIDKGNYGNIKLYAVFSPNTYTVIYDVNGGNELPVSTEEFVYDSSYQLKIPVRVGYSFVCWNLDGTPISTNGEWTIYRDVTLVAEWELLTYKITYIMNGGNNNPNNKTKYTYEDDDYVISNPFKEGYTFTGWDDGNGVLNKNYVIKNHTTGTIDLEANWQPNTYTVTLDVNGGDPLEKNNYQFTYDDTFVLPYPKKYGYVFSGWYYGETKISSDVWTIPHNVTLTAEWVLEQYQIVYVLNGGINNYLNPPGYTYEDETTTILPASRTGYSFVGWSEEEGGEPLSVMQIKHNSVGDKTFYANWQPNNYQVTYDLSGGTGIDELVEIVTFDDNYISPVPLKKGHTFVGWYYEGSKIEDGIWKISKDCTFVARWQANEYIVTKKNGDVDGTQGVTFGTDYNLGILHKDDYSFSGWYSETNCNGTQYTDENGNSNNPYIDDENITLYAGFTYSVSFVTNGGTEVSQITLHENECLSDTITSAKNGRTFAGWYSDPELTKPISYSAPLGNITLYAKWAEEVEPAQINYKIDSNAITINGISSTDTNIILPSHIGGLPVKSISDFSCKQKQNIVYLEIPDTVTYIGPSSFSGCNSIVNITLPFVGEAVSGATAPRSVFGHIFGSNDYYYEGTTRQGTKYYYIPSSIRNVTITKQTNIPDYAFQNCKYLESITIPASTSSIGSYAFDGCTNLKKLNSDVDGVFNVPSGVTSISGYCFNNCKEVTEVLLSNSITSIGRNAFSGCSNIIRFNSAEDGYLIVPESCALIDSSAFQSLGRITDVVVTDAVTSIGLSSFSGCNSIVNITLPFVGEAVSGATAPRSVFGHIFGSNDYYYEGTTRQGTKYYYIPSSIRNVTITKQTNIPDYAFQNCKYLESITIPASTSSIGSYAFDGCMATIIYS